MSPSPRESGKGIRDLFEHPELWEKTRSVVDVLFCADHTTGLFKDAELRDWFAKLRQWKIQFAIETGAIKPWSATGEKTFHLEQPTWDRIQRLGGSIDAVAMDEPLCCARLSLKATDDYAVQETANYIALVRKHYPHAQVGDIESYPSIPIADHYRWIEALETRLAAMHVRGLDFYRLDVDWVAYTLVPQGSWLEVRNLERYCRARKLPFSLIYWASGFPHMEHRGLADDATWYVGIMQQGYDYLAVGGAPDQYVIESWVNGPVRNVPESGDFTFTRSVYDFARKFVTSD
jgi:hypothetical protein